MYGSTSYYSLTATVRHDAAYTTLEVNPGGAPSRASFPLQNNIFVVPSKTSAEGSRADFALAARSAYSRLEVNISAPIRQQGTLAPLIKTHRADAQPATNPALIVPGYQLWEGSVDLGAPATGAVTVAVAATNEDGEVALDALYLSAGVAGW